MQVGADLNCRYGTPQKSDRVVTLADAPDSESVGTPQLVTRWIDKSFDRET